jgi:hypothetical protein
VARGVTDDQITALGAKKMTSEKFAELSFLAKHVISF